MQHFSGSLAKPASIVSVAVPFAAAPLAKRNVARTADALQWHQTIESQQKTTRREGEQRTQEYLAPSASRMWIEHIQQG